MKRGRLSKGARCRWDGVALTLPTLLDNARDLTMDLLELALPLDAVWPRAGGWVRQPCGHEPEIGPGRGLRTCASCDEVERRRQPRRSRPGWRLTSTEIGDGARRPSLRTTDTAT